jgi:phosphoglycerate dehydrogenase-like enzyme
VTAEELIGADNPLIRMPDAILTGHSAFYSISLDKELFLTPMSQVVMALKGE